MAALQVREEEEQEKDKSKKVRDEDERELGNFGKRQLLTYG